MLTQDEAERIARLLTEAQDAEQLARKVSLLARCEDPAEEFKQLFRSDLEWGMRSMETLDSQQESRAGGQVVGRAAPVLKLPED